jgi:hypothetical protein
LRRGWEPHNDASRKRKEEFALAEDNYHKDRIANRRLHPETLMMGYGYAPRRLSFSRTLSKARIFSTLHRVAGSRVQARNRVWFIPASTIPISKSWKIG